MSPVVDVVIPVHSESRPVERAVSSITGSTAADVRITVICHGIDPAPVAERVRHPRVRVIQHVDGVASAAGPVNAGLAIADARYVSRLDSDDWFEPGAIDRWLQEAEKTDADVIIAPLRGESAEPLYAPLTRPFRHRRLDAVKDRLAYRTAPFGLIRRRTLEALDARYTPSLKVGEDLEIGLKLWFLSRRVDLAVHAPCYVVGADAADRTTEVTMPVADELEASARLLHLDWVLRLSRDEKLAVAVKLARIHVLGALAKRPTAGQWSSEDVGQLRSFLGELAGFSPTVLRPFSRSDRTLLERAGSAAVGEDLADAIAEHSASSAIDSVLSREWASNFSRESTFRRYVRYRLPR